VIANSPSQNSLPKMLPEPVIPSEARNLSELKAKKKRDSSSLPSLCSGQAAPRNDTDLEFSHRF
jgi:hypothetical protein